MQNGIREQFNGKCWKRGNYVYITKEVIEHLLKFFPVKTELATVLGVSNCSINKMLKGTQKTLKINYDTFKEWIDAFKEV
jgi:hypothetical protein